MKTASSSTLIISSYNSFTMSSYDVSIQHFTKLQEFINYSTWKQLIKYSLVSEKLWNMISKKKKVSENISICNDWRIHNNSHSWKSMMNWLKTKKQDYWSYYAQCYFRSWCSYWEWNDNERRCEKTNFMTSKIQSSIHSSKQSLSCQLDQFAFINEYVSKFKKLAKTLADQWHVINNKEKSFSFLLIKILLLYKSQQNTLWLKRKYLNLMNWY
jgi:hypothetical protein